MVKKVAYSCALLMCVAGIARANLSAPLPAASNVIHRVLEKSKTSATNELASAYTYRKKSRTEELDERDKVLRTTEKLYNVSLISGVPFNKLVQIEGRKLTPKELEKENQREAAFRERVSRVDFKKKARRGEAIVTRDLANRFDFTLTGRELVEGRPTLVLKFTPRADAPDKSIEDKIYARVSGTIWVDEAEDELTKLEATVRGPVPLGWFGAVGSLRNFQATLERIRMPDGVWLNHKSSFYVAARKLFSPLHLRTVEHSSDFQRK